MPVDTFSLAGKSAIITGSGRENGIGAAIARTLARNGASVVINYVSDSTRPRAEATAQSIRDEFGVKVALIQADISTPEGAQGLVSETLEKLGVDHIDILVNNAGGGPVQSIRDTSLETLQKEFATNVFGTVFMTQAVVELGKMPRGGRIINIGSIAPKMNPPLLAVYAATKGAQNSLTVTWAAELGRGHGITVNTIAPGPVTTDINKDCPEVMIPMAEQQRGDSRFGVPQDIADAVLLIVSEKSHWITAQVIHVDSGVVVGG
ncbi:putative short-chain dehydrogenase [Hypoxylon trugodes]|uniref:putative short-chain dehydrogenase n=1 Tax=Hypoxylon trugodes TaxID=326681 RepID=UPI002195839D|nr:putative short-chain dehydrogenase [Hypoxylon trugodes]KAI1394011.1 putative short-chain dehydrogenase [Hypoxylon trugodes]